MRRSRPWRRWDCRPLVTLPDGSVMKPIARTGSEAIDAPVEDATRDAMPSLEAPIVGDTELTQASLDTMVDDAPTGGEVEDGNAELKDGDTGVSGAKQATQDPAAIADVGAGVFSSPTGTTNALCAEHMFRLAPSASDALEPIHHGEGSPRRPCPPSSVAGSSWELGPVLDLMSTDEGHPGVPPGELFQAPHRAINQLGAGLAAERNALARERRSLVEAWKVHFAQTDRARKEDEDTRTLVAHALAEAKGILDRAADKAHEAPNLTQVELDAANVRAADVQWREEALLSSEASLRRRERDLDAHEKAVAELEADARTHEAGAEKTASDLSTERARLELLWEALDAQKTKLERRETNIVSQEAALQANVGAADAALRRKRDEQEASNKKTLTEALTKQKEDARSEYRQKLALQETRFVEKNKILEAKHADLEK